MFWALVFFIFPLSCSALVEDELCRVVQVSAGGEYPLKIRLSNSEDRPIVVHLKQSDYSYCASGENYYLPPGTLARSNANWVELDETCIKIPSKSSVDAHYTIRTPQKIPAEGSFSSLILIEPDLFSEEAAIKVRLRFAHQIVTNIGGGKAELELLEKRFDPISSLLYLDVANSGEIFLDPVLTFKIYSEEGKLVENISGGRQKILPESSVRYTLDLKRIPAGSYHAIALFNEGQFYFGEKLLFSIPSS